MRRPRSRTSCNPDGKSITPAATSAVNSPSEWPATIVGSTFCPASASRSLSASNAAMLTVRIAGVFELVRRTMKAEPGEWKPEDLVGLIKHPPRRRRGVIECLAHPNELAALPREHQRYLACQRIHLTGRPLAHVQVQNIGVITTQ